MLGKVKSHSRKSKGKGNSSVKSHSRKGKSKKGKTTYTGLLKTGDLYHRGNTVTHVDDYGPKGDRIVPYKRKVVVAGSKKKHHYKRVLAASKAMGKPTSQVQKNIGSRRGKGKGKRKW